MFTFLGAFALICVQSGAVVARRADNPAFMLVSGISAPSEMCVSVENGFLVSLLSDIQHDGGLILLTFYGRPHRCRRGCSRC